MHICFNENKFISGNQLAKHLFINKFNTIQYNSGRETHIACIHFLWETNGINYWSDYERTINKTERIWIDSVALRVIYDMSRIPSEKTHFLQTTRIEFCRFVDIFYILFTSELRVKNQNAEINRQINKLQCLWSVEWIFFLKEYKAYRIILEATESGSNRYLTFPATFLYEYLISFYLE